VIVKKFEESKVLEVVDKITKNLLEGQEDLRDIYATGVKTIIGAMPKVIKTKQTKKSDRCVGLMDWSHSKVISRIKP
jgi:hypothetical protein